MDQEKIKDIARRFVDGLDTRERLVASRKANKTLLGKSPSEGYSSEEYKHMTNQIELKLLKLLSDEVSPLDLRTEDVDAIRKEATTILIKEPIIELRRGKEYEVGEEKLIGKRK